MTQKRSWAFVDGTGKCRHMIVDEADAAANVRAGETLEEVPAGLQVIPGRTTFTGGEFQEN